MPLRTNIRPLRDALCAALGVFGCFAGSALWIYYQARKNEVAHHREVIEAAAWRVAGSVEPGLLVADHPGSGAGAVTLARLRAIDLADSPIGRVMLTRPVGNENRHQIVYAFNATDSPASGKFQWEWDPALASELGAAESALAGKVVKSAAAHTVFRQDGTIMAYAPILAADGTVVGVATAESAPHSLKEGLSAIGWAAFSALLVGAVLALATCAGVYTSRRRSQRESERLFHAERVDRLIVEAMGEILYEHDPVTDGMRWRGDVERVVGLPVERLPCGRDWQERIHPEDRAIFHETRRQSLSGKNPFSAEYRVRREDGQYIWLLDRGGYLAEDAVSPAMVIGVILDVTPSREAEQRLRDVVDAAGEYIWEVDADGRYTYVSDRVGEVLGQNPQEMLGREPFDFVPEDDQEAVRRTSGTLVERQAKFSDFEHRVLRADGRMIWLSVNGVPTFDANGAWSGYRGAGLDITARREVEQALIEEKEAANAAVRTKSEFLAMMSHEIRTPLNSVLGFADLLAGTELGDAQREHVALIQRSGDALLVLLNDILDFSRIESGGWTLVVSEVDIRACMQEVIDLYRPAADEKKLLILLQVDEDVPRAVITDEARLRQILLNLVGNAVKFTERGFVKIRASANPPLADGRCSLRIEVCDTGIGIPPEKADRLFRPFSQVDSSATRRFGGTGLGLAICRRLADLLGGEVGLKESGPGGCVFYLILNAAEAAADSMPAPVPADRLRREPPVANPATDGVRRVLVAEDNPVNRLLMQRMLASLGVPSQEAVHGGECVRLHAENAYDVILMDVQMPVLDGLEATRRIREAEKLDPLKRRVKIIALTADAMAEDRVRCLDAGMDDYLSKPIRIEVLLSVVDRYNLRHPD